MEKKEIKGLDMTEPSRKAPLTTLQANNYLRKVNNNPTDQLLFHFDSL